MKTAVLLVSLFLELVVFPAAGLGAGPRYYFQNISPPPGWCNFDPLLPGAAIDINNSGQVLLSSRVLYTPDGNWILIDDGYQTLSGQPFKINNAGQVVGYGYDHAYLWTIDQGLQLLPGINGQESLAAFDINNVGQIVGVYGNNVPVKWDGPNAPVDLASLPGWHSSEVTDAGISNLNDSGLMAGRAWVDGKGNFGALFNGNGWVFLGGLDPDNQASYPNCLNNKGEVGGFSDTLAGGGGKACLPLVQRGHAEPGDTAGVSS